MAPVAPSPPQYLEYMNNDIVEIKGEEYMKAMQLRKGSASIRIICDSCKTLLGSVHFLYFRNVVMVVPAVCKFEHEGEPLAPCMRIQTKFYDEEKHGGPIPPFSPPENSYVCDNPMWPFSSGLLKKFAFPRVTDRKGQSFQDIVKRLGEPIIAGVEEPDLEGHFKTGGGMFSLTFCNPFAGDNKDKNTDEDDDNE